MYSQRSIIHILLLTCTLLAALVMGCMTPQVDEPPPGLHENQIIPMKGAGDKYDLSYLKDSDPAIVDNSNLPVTPIDRLSFTGRPPKTVDGQTYRLTISGMVANTLDLAYNDLLSLPSVTQVVLLICHGSHVDNAEWTGIPISILLDKAGVMDSAHEATFIALDRYSRTIPVDALRKDGVFLAYKVNGETIPLKHGYPLRLIVQGMYGENWVKWLRQIDIK